MSPCHPAPSHRRGAGLWHSLQVPFLPRGLLQQRGSLPPAPLLLCAHLPVSPGLHRPALPGGRGGLSAPGQPRWVPVPRAPSRLGQPWGTKGTAVVFPADLPRRSVRLQVRALQNATAGEVNASVRSWQGTGCHGGSGTGGCCGVGCPCLLHPVHPLPGHPQGSSSSFPCAPRWSPRQEGGRAALGAGARCLQPSAHPHTPLGTGLGHPGLPGGEGFPGQHQHHPHVSVEQTREGLGYKGHFSPWAIQESVLPAPRFLNL